MPSKTKTEAQTDRHLTRLPDADGGQPAAPARTATEIKLWAALTAHPGSCTAELASQAGIGTSTAGKILPRWQQSGHITRTTGQLDGKRRAPGTWSIAEPAAQPTAADTNPDIARDAADRRRPNNRKSTAQAEPGRKAPAETARNGSGARRLASGELRGVVEDFLREPDRAGKEYTPGEIARKLERSAGAVSNCLDKLQAHGTVAQTNDKPRRFRLATAAED